MEVNADLNFPHGNEPVVLDHKACVTRKVAYKVGNTLEISNGSMNLSIAGRSNGSRDSSNLEGLDAASEHYSAELVTHFPTTTAFLG